ncbi:MAG: cupin domain-containing protein [Candidatus Binatia bacterium]
MPRLAIAGILWTITGCAAVPHLILPNGQVANRTAVSAMLAAHPLPPGDNISASLLGRTASLSYHLIQIRDREPPHLHAAHDLAVTVLRGTGRLYVAGEPHDMRTGDVAVIAHGTPHYFVNSGSEPAVAFAVFAPPYDGKDQVPME